MEQILQIPKRFWDDQKWVFNHYSKLGEKYGDRWIAVLNHRVISSSKNLTRVNEIAKKKVGVAILPTVYIDKGHRVY